MVNYLLMIAADLENLTDLQPQGGCDDPNFTYYFKLKCGNCGEVTQKETCVCLNDTVPSAKSKSDTHLSQKCKFCSRDGTVTMITGRGRPLSQEEAETGKYAPLMFFDCRGYEPVDFAFGSGWKAQSTEGTKFNDIDLSGGEFAEYDEKGECPVMISNLRAKFDVVK
ncbi:upf0587 protein c1orf123 homolog [Phtheirospermum japonicum]|uniref:Upf0587 protein c1orf123 homolog n=1 Tax=Phtheirospermum japonicum TaxID=374723 RepID=A0A830BXC7_9LAMI|nr:upf0587 protein c1orf123 homolog [Phtheirospermum japonicum]